MPNIVFHFAVVVYLAYSPQREQYKATITPPGRASISFERPTWEQLFQDIEGAYPGVEFEIPDELEFITFDSQFQLIKE